MTQPWIEGRFEEVTAGRLEKDYADPQLADRFDAQVTPESYVIDSQGIIRYHGSIDDQQNESRVRQRRLRAALDEVLAGKDVQAKQTKAFGCTIKFKS